MNGTKEGGVGPRTTEMTETIRIRCKADRRVYGIDVEWMKGAIFEFESEDEARAWVEEQNLGVPGTLFLESAPDSDDELSVDFHLKYSRSG